MLMTSRNCLFLERLRRARERSLQRCLHFLQTSGEYGCEDTRAMLCHFVMCCTTLFVSCVFVLCHQYSYDFCVFFASLQLTCGSGAAFNTRYLLLYCTLSFLEMVVSTVSMKKSMPQPPTCKVTRSTKSGSSRFSLEFKMNHCIHCKPAHACIHAHTYKTTTSPPPRSGEAAANMAAEASG